MQALQYLQLLKGKRGKADSETLEEADVDSEVGGGEGRVGRRKGASEGRVGRGRVERGRVRRGEDERG